MDESAHFWADTGPELIQTIETIEIIEVLERSLKKSEFSFTFDEYCREKLSLCKTFLRKSGGSTVNDKATTDSIRSHGDTGMQRLLVSYEDNNISW